MNLNKVSLNLIGLNENTVYYWRVSATDGITVSSWSDIWNFTTKTLTNTDYVGNREIEIYPVPADDFLTVSGAEENLNISIFNVTGKIIFNEKNISNKKINISNFKSGIYFIRIEEKDKIFIKKFIVKH